MAAVSQHDLSQFTTIDESSLERLEVSKNSGCLANAGPARFPAQLTYSLRKVFVM